MIGDNYNESLYQCQAQLYALDNRLELKTAQVHCFNVAGRMLCAAEHLSYLLKGKKLEKKNEIFGYYNSFNFADTKDAKELKSNMTEQMDNFARMKRKFKEKFDLNLLLPLKKEELEKFFNYLMEGLDNKNRNLYKAMLNLLINDKNNDYQIEIDNYYETFNYLQNQKLELDPNYLMTYYPAIENNIRILRKEIKKKYEENNNFQPTMHLNEKYLKNPITQFFNQNAKKNNRQIKAQKNNDEENNINAEENDNKAYLDIFKE